MAQNKHIPDPQVLAVFEKMIAGVEGVELKGDQNPYCSINGNMYAQMSKLDRIGIRLSKADLAEFLETYDAGLHEGYPGFVQKEYAAIPESLYGDIETLKAWFRRSHDFAASLKPKPTKR
jgi:RIO-like serine/threonine protein kinase